MKENYDLIIKALEKERDELLEAYPELKKLQLEIDQSLEGIEDPLERAAILNKLLIQKLSQDLLPSIAKLRQVESEVRAKENLLESCDLKKKAA